MSSWDESKRRRNLEVHRLDFVDAEAIWDCFTITREDVRRSYGERRWVTFGLMNGEVVVLVHTERSGSELHIISLRKAERYEARYYFEAVQAELGEG